MITIADISFWGGVGVIGSSKVLIEQGEWRVLLDFGLDFQPGAGLFRGSVRPRPGQILKDRLRVGGAPWIPHLYRADAMAGLDLAGGSDGHTALFITHGHIDHVGLTGWVDPDIPIYASPETQRLLEALSDSGQGTEGGQAKVQALQAGAPLDFGPFRITRYPVDHDVVGASGYSVETDDGIVAFTGDIRLHGRHPDRSLHFAEQVQGARALVIEGTTLSSGFRHAQKPECDVDREFENCLAHTPGLVWMTMYPRNLERVEAFLAIARRYDRTILWPDSQARFLARWALGEAQALSDVIPTAIAEHPERYIIQMEVSEIPRLLEFPHGPGTVFIHSNGEPLGPFDPDYALLHEWLTLAHVPFWSIGTSGHASPDDLRLLVEKIHPDILFPLHSMEPDRLLPPPGTKRWLPERGGRRFSLA